MTDEPPYCQVHGCRGRWDPDQAHTLCGKSVENFNVSNVKDYFPERGDDGSHAQTVAT